MYVKKVMIKINIGYVKNRKTIDKEKINKTITICKIYLE